MNWSCPVCQKDFSIKDNLHRYRNSKHSNSNLAGKDKRIVNVLPGEEGFNQVQVEGNIPQELLRCLKQQNLSTDPHLLAMQRLQSGMDSTLAISQRPRRK